jgi:hypothetical protein
MSEKGKEIVRFPLSILIWNARASSETQRLSTVVHAGCGRLLEGLNEMMRSGETGTRCCGMETIVRQTVGDGTSNVSALQQLAERATAWECGAR